MKIGLLISGNLGFIMLNHLINSKALDICFVFTDSRSRSITQVCQEKKIPLYTGNPREGKATGFINNQNKVDLVLSINYLFIIEKDLIEMSNGYAINIHGSLLPKYRGRTPHVWSIINNEKKAGISAHIITEECDAGDIIEQLEIPIEENHTGQDLLNQYNALYPSFIENVISKIKTGKVTLTPQDITKASHFGKREPADGHVNWSWQKERIYNWVRALASPYPRAFSFISDTIVYINACTYSDLGFHYQIPNGLIVQVERNSFFVKTPNGVLKITEFETQAEIKKGDILT